jgi:signal transduction histidine kinase/CheY-like chemotaxis protein
MSSEEKPAIPSAEGTPPGELERALAELRQANEQLVLAGLRFQEMVEQAEHARADAERQRLRAETARAQAEAASVAKDEFLAALSHELRTPLNAILGWTAMLRQGALKADAIDRALETIERNARQQFQVIADLLQVSEIITGKLQLDAHPMDLRPLIATGIETMRPAAIAKEIEFESEIDSVDPILGDPGRLQQIIWNLLSNAVKFTPRRGHIRVGLTQKGSLLQFSVTDSGVGIEPAFLRYIFDRYRQEDSSYARTFGGLGLGLAIVRQLVELHGGTVTAESAGKGLGSAFTVSFPTLRSSQDRRSFHDETTADQPLQGVQVLLVEGEEDTRDMVTMLLEGSGADVTTASSATEALAQIERRMPDLIVADIGGLPDEDRYTFIARVRQREGGRADRVPALALTAYGRPEDRDRALAAGYQVHIGKPFIPDQVIAAATRLARRTDVSNLPEDAAGTRARQPLAPRGGQAIASRSSTRKPRSRAGRPHRRKRPPADKE